MLKLIIISMFILHGLGACVELKTDLWTVTVSDNTGTLTTKDLRCQGAGSLPASSDNFPSPISFFQFGEPITVEMTIFDHYSHCNLDAKCGKTCPLTGGGACLNPKTEFTPYCVFTYPMKTKKYLAYPLIYQQALLWYPGKFRLTRTGSFSAFVRLSGWTIIDMSHEMYRDSMKIMNVSSNYDLSNSYIIPAAENLLTDNANINLLQSPPKTEILNKGDFNCKDEVIMVETMQDKDLDKAVDIPFDLVAVTGPAKYNYSLPDLVNGKLVGVTVNGTTRFWGSRLIFWDPCNMDAVELRVEFLDFKWDYNAYLQSDWVGETICVMVSEDDQISYGLVEWDFMNELFIPSKRWVGAFSSKFIDTYDLRYVSMSTVSTPDNIVEIDMAFPPKDNDNLEVQVRASQATECHFQFSEACSENVTFTATTLSVSLKLMGCFPFLPRISFLCQASSGYIASPEYLRETVRLLQTDPIVTYHKPPVLPQEQTNQNEGTTIEKLSIRDYLTDFSWDANVYRAILVLSSMIVIMTVIILSRMIVRKYKRKNSYKIHSQVVHWRKV